MRRLYYTDAVEKMRREVKTFFANILSNSKEISSVVSCSIIQKETK